MLTPKALSNGVKEYKLLRITSGFCPDLNSITILTPSLSDSSLISDIPSTFLSLASSAIFSTNLALFCWYGISEIIIFDFSLESFSISAFALKTTLPLPVLAASINPEEPFIIPPVGKSGPGIIFINSSISILGFSNKAKLAFIDSVKLWGNMLVAMPTAIPADPFTSKLGILVGSTSGINSVPS